MKKQESNPFEGFEELNSLGFVKLPETLEQKMLSNVNHLGIKVQSVFLPPNFNEVRDEKKVVDWLYNNIQSLHTANYELRLKYATD